MSPADAEFLSQGFAEQFEEALTEAWDDDWDWGDDDVPVPHCDLENPDVCESCT